MKGKSSYVLLLAAAMLLVWACTPKVVEETVEKEETEKPVTPPKPKEVLTTCPTFDDAPNPEEATTNYVLCKDEIRAKNYEAAFPLWKKVYEVSPAADGRRNLVFIWGTEIYNHKFEQATDAAEKQKYVNRVKELYNELADCFPKEKGFVQGRLAFDMYYKYPDYATTQEKYDLFKEAIDASGMKTQPFVLNPLTALVREQYDAGAIKMAEAQKYANKIWDVLEYGLENSTGNTLENFKIVESYAPFRLQEFEAVKGFYDCDYYKKHYLSKYEEDKDECEVMIDVYSRLRWGNCPETDAKLQEINKNYSDKCVVASTPTDNGSSQPSPSSNSCNSLLRSGDYQGAVDCLEEKYNASTDENVKAKYAYSIASITYSKFKRYANARTWAEKAARHDPSWGKPHLLIGDMYAGSGPICGSGRGWNSQVVVWAAMDEWSKAKKDSSVASKAQSRINKYAQYQPDKEQCILNAVPDGSSYKVGCWIQRTTTARCR